MGERTKEKVWQEELKVTGGAVTGTVKEFSTRGTSVASRSRTPGGRA